MINLSSNVSTAAANVSFPSIRWSRVTTSLLDPENFQLTRNVSEVLVRFAKSKPRIRTYIPFVSVRVSAVLSVFPPNKGPSVRSFPVATACQPRQSGQPMVGSVSLLALFISLVVRGGEQRSSGCGRRKGKSSGGAQFLSD